jgi:hypothetical protein
LPTGTPQALAGRVALSMMLAATLIGTMVSVPASQAQTPPLEGMVRLSPAMSDVPGNAGPFTVYVVAEDLQHDGAIIYDDNRDQTPDRSVPSVGLAAYQITIEYNPAVLAVGGVEPGPDLGRTGRSFQCLPPIRLPGSFSFGCISSGDAAPGTQGTLTLASIELVPQGPGLSPMSLDAVLAGPLGDSFTVAVSGGAARVTGTVAPTPTGASPVSSVTPAAGLTLTPAQSKTASARTATQTLSQTMAKPVTPVKSVTPGDVGASPTSRSNPPSPGSSGGHSFRGAVLWSVVIAGGVGASGLLGMAALVWRQRQHRRGT